MPEPLKLAIVTDIHHGPEKFSKKGAAALPLLSEFAAFVAAEAPDAVIDLGDRITDIDRETDQRLMGDVAGAFAAITTPRFHLLGNHDVAHLSQHDNEDAFGVSFAHASIDLKGWHLVFWQPDTHLTYPAGFQRRNDDIEWLRRNLASTNLPTVVFSHVPLDSASMTGNYWFENNPQFAGQAFASEIRELLQDAGTVVACVAGHVHWNNLSVIDGISYISVQSLTESYSTADRASGAWATITLGDDLHWQTHGDDPIDLRRPVRHGNERWLTPLPSFERLRADALTRRGFADIDGVILDMDGVLYRGESAISTATRAMAALADAGIEVVAVTNNARSSPSAYSEKLAGFGIDLPAEKIITSGTALTAFLADRENHATVFVAGSGELRRAVVAAGAQETDGVPTYVVAGIDGDMTVGELGIAAAHLLNGAELVVSNADRLIPTADGFEPEAGAVAAFLESASGKTAHVVGKPNPGIFDLAIDTLGVPRERILMVGDTPETDLAGARAAGIRAAHVQSGNTANRGDTLGFPSFPDLAAVVNEVLAAR